METTLIEAQHPDGIAVRLKTAIPTSGCCWCLQSFDDADYAVIFDYTNNDVPTPDNATHLCINCVQSLTSAIRGTNPDNTDGAIYWGEDRIHVQVLYHTVDGPRDNPCVMCGQANRRDSYGLSLGLGEDACVFVHWGCCSTLATVLEDIFDEYPAELLGSTL